MTYSSFGKKVEMGEWMNERASEEHAVVEKTLAWNLKTWSSYF